MSRFSTYTDETKLGFVLQAIVIKEDVHLVARREVDLYLESKMYVNLVIIHCLICV